MECPVCHGTYVAWDSRMLDQLTDGMKASFPCVLTHKYACDEAVITLLRARTLGNSPTALQHNLQELHSEDWLRRQLRYLTDCEQHRRGRAALNLRIPQYQPPSPFPQFPTAKWLLVVYVKDVWSRLPALLAQATSIYGQVLKIDGTKKVCKKLQGQAANSASWAVNVGNERGEIVHSVLTDSEGIPALQKLADGLINRYSRAGQPPPVLLYTDRDCCCTNGPSKYQILFQKWDGIRVRLDIWHYIRRLAGGCSTESHPLYGTFMAGLSACIFEWDSGDYQLLMQAKRAELIAAGIPNPSGDAVKKAIKKEELARHCRRKTRGVEQTMELIEELLLSLSTATDTLGVPLFKEEMTTIWEEQKKHVRCIQDPPGIQLYTIVGHMTIGGMRLPVLRCARGTTSLESFHLHLARFIPGTSAGAVNFQAYLLDGITRWNTSRAEAALRSAGPEESLRSFNTRLKDKVNLLHSTIFISLTPLTLMIIIRSTPSVSLFTEVRCFQLTNHHHHIQESSVG